MNSYEYQFINAVRNWVNSPKRVVLCTVNLSSWANNCMCEWVIAACVSIKSVEFIFHSKLKTENEKQRQWDSCSVFCLFSELNGTRFSIFLSQCMSLCRFFLLSTSFGMWWQLNKWIKTLLCNRKLAAHYIWTARFDVLSIEWLFKWNEKKKFHYG